MSVNVKGIKELEKQINNELTSRKASTAINKAVNKGGDTVVEELKREFDKFSNTGASRDEIVRSDARNSNNVRGLKVGWEGPKDRWRLIHLNEFGYSKAGKQFRPKGMGTIVRTTENSKGKYFNTVFEEMKKNYD